MVSKPSGTSHSVKDSGDDLKKFERSIVQKPTREEILFSDDSIPAAWPQKWFYETDDYAYWTIKGDPAKSATEAIEISRQKAASLVDREYSSTYYIRPPKYETTHTEVKKKEGKYIGWRLIRLKQKEIIMNRK